MTTKPLIVYYSRRGENYLNGTIVSLDKGNTEVVAEKIARLTGGSLFRLETVEPYPENYDECTRRAQRELRADARPRLSADVDDLSAVETLYLGFPNWWGTMPMAVHTFLSAHDFTGKTIVPFCTHEGSGMGHALADIRRLCPGATVEEGVAIRGGRVATSDEIVRKLVERR